MSINVNRDGICEGSTAGKSQGPRERQRIGTGGRRDPRVRVDAISRDAITAESVVRQSHGHVSGRDGYRDGTVRVRALDVQNSQCQWFSNMVVIDDRV